jgi:hypothetical protein
MTGKGADTRIRLAVIRRFVLIREKEMLLLQIFHFLQELPVQNPAGHLTGRV